MDPTTKAPAESEAIVNMRVDVAKLRAAVPDKPEFSDMDANFAAFESLFAQYMQEHSHKINWDRIQPPPADMIKRHQDLPEPQHDDKVAFLRKLAVLKLNGGLGTSMGCVGPKSAITVRDDLTFLDLTVRQIAALNSLYGVDVPLVLMNSFNTHADTEVILRKYHGVNVRIEKFNQSRFPRVVKEPLAPLPKNFSNDEDWYPPGHGDLYASLARSGLLDSLLAQGIEYLFVSNIDNLGAVVDFRIANFLQANPQCEFVMEVTDKTRADVKGGTLIQYEDRLRLLELAQVPKDHVEDFKAVTKFRIFNTNNLWIKLGAVRRLVDQPGGLHMEVIENKKSVGGRAIVQLETAVGSAIKNFQHAVGVNVPRARFLPVKKTDDLLLVMSNLYHLRHGELAMSPQRLFNTVPLIKLGDDHFKKVSDFLRRFETIPNILELDHLTVSGDVTFGPGVTLKGTVIIIANHGERIDIPAGAILENKIVTGNLRIMEH